MSLLSRRLVSSSMFLVAAGFSMVSIYGLFSGQDLTTYDYISGIFSTVSNLLWMGASSYDIYLTCTLKQEEHLRNEYIVDDNNQIDDIEKQLKNRNESLPGYKPIIKKMKVVTPSIKRRHSSDNIIAMNETNEAELHIEFKHQDKKQSVRIPGIFYEKRRNSHKNSDESYENHSEITYS